jgi:2Fe-2S ferredoxin
MPQMFFIDKKGSSRACDFATGDTILMVARKNNIDIEGACDGSMACATCHVIVAPQWIAELPTASEGENAMLDIATGVTKNSRLGCQIILTNALDGLTVTIA